MKPIKFIYVIAMVLTILQSPGIWANSQMTEAQVQVEWGGFKNAFKRAYSPDEEKRRYDIFKKNLAKIEELNSKNQSLNGHKPFGVNEFTDRDPEEFAQARLNYRHSSSRHISQVEAAPVTADVPASFDWTGSGATSPIKDQGECGSCWAFSAVEELESATYLTAGSLPLLSPQQVNSCSPQDGGCNGGNTTSAFSYMISHGVESEASYPYTSGKSGQTGSCQYDSKSVAARLTGFHYGVSPCDDTSDSTCQNQTKLEPTLQQTLVSNGPASVCLNATPWQYYTGGVMAGANCASDVNSMNHCVQLVGYATKSDGSKYWVLRNQWGTSWGENGFIYLQMGTNTCGMMNEVTYVDGASLANGPTPTPPPAPTPTPVPTPVPPPTPTPVPTPIPTPTPPSPVCVRANPTVTLSPDSQVVQAGGMVAYQVSVVDNDTAACGSSVMRIGGSLPFQLRGQVSSSYVNIDPGKTATVRLLLQSQRRGRGSFSFMIGASNVYMPQYKSTTQGMLTVL